MGAVLFWILPAHGAILSQSPGGKATLLNERVVIFFDPLAQRQTTLVRFETSTTQRRLGLILPLPPNAEVYAGDDRLFDLVIRRQKRRVDRERRVRITLTSWIANALIEDVGFEPGSAPKIVGATRASVQHSNLGKAPASVSAWLTKHGFTLSAAQFAWLSDLRQAGYGVYSLVIEPSHDGLSQWTPSLTIVQEATQPSYPARHVPFDLATVNSSLPTPLNILAISEWPMQMLDPAQGKPFLIDRLSGTAVQDMVRSTRSHRLTYRRGGYLTAFEGPRSSTADMHGFVRAPSLSTMRPPATKTFVNVDVTLPVELCLFTCGLLIWAWRTSRASRRAKLGPLR